MTLLPVAYTALTTVAVFFQAAKYYFGSISLEASGMETFLSGTFFVQLTYFFSVLSLVLTLVYLIHIIRNPRIASLEIRGLWVVLLLLGNMVTMPVYWFVHIWREEEMGIMG